MEEEERESSLPELSCIHKRQLERESLVSGFNSGDNNWGAGRKRGGQGVGHLDDPLTERSPGHSRGRHTDAVADPWTQGQVKICLSLQEVIEY